MTLTSMGLGVHYLMAVLAHCEKLAEEVLQDHCLMELDEQL